MTDQPLIVAVSEPWGLYCNAITADPEAITRQSMTLNQARDFVRRSPRAEGQPPAVIPSFTELGRRLVAAGITELNERDPRSSLYCGGGAHVPSDYGPPE